MKPRLVLSQGDPAGIGPELLLKIAGWPPPVACDLVFVAGIGRRADGTSGADSLLNDFVAGDCRCAGEDFAKNLRRRLSHGHVPGCRHHRSERADAMRVFEGHRLRNLAIGAVVLIAGVAGLLFPVTAYSGGNSTVACGNAVIAKEPTPTTSNLGGLGIQLPDQPNAHPDYRELKFDLSQERVAVIGNGNVAMDVARILASSYEELRKTDIADYALEALRNSRVTDIYMLGRRGPAQAAFTNPELKEFGELAEADVVVPPEEIALDPAS